MILTFLQKKLYKIVYIVFFISYFYFMWNPQNTWKEIIHDEKIKNRYSSLEKEIKNQLTSLLLLYRIWTSNEICRWLSISKDFDIIELSETDNPKFISNPATIKNEINSTTPEQVKSNLHDLIKKKVKNKKIREAYIEWVDKFIKTIQTKSKQALFSLLNTRHKHDEINKSNKGSLDFYIKYLKQYNREDISKEQYNIRIQLAKILFREFWNDAFEEKEWKIALSEISLNYIRTLFYNANKVWDDWWRTLDKVFHDWDFHYIINITNEKPDEKPDEQEYIDVISYLIDKHKENDYWKRWVEWNSRWCEQTAKYADILWALTNKQLGISKWSYLWEKEPNFSRDKATTILHKKSNEFLGQVIDEYKNENPSIYLSSTSRLKSLSSVIEKIIEWKYVNDSIWLRISTININKDNYQDIANISENFFRRLISNLNNHQNDYVDDWQKISIKKISIDNKGVLSDKNIDELIGILENIDKDKDNYIWRREKPENPYIEKKDWIERIELQYPEIKENNQFEVIKSFYEQISWWKARWSNWWYKDFKYNIVFEIKDNSWNSIWEKTMEIQFDDINNWKWLANYNIRNIERWLNTQSRLSFFVSLPSLRQHCEEDIKMLSRWAKKTTEKLNENSNSNISQEDIDSFSEIDIDNNKYSINGLNYRNKENWQTIDEITVWIINYFIKKWTFILCFKWKKPPIDRLLTVDDLKDEKIMKSLKFCSSLELASQQHSYLQKDWKTNVWIYMDDGKIWWMSTWKLIDLMNLWKKKSNSDIYAPLT